MIPAIVQKTVSIVKIGGERLMHFIREGLPERALRKSNENAEQFDAVFAQVDEAHRKFHEAAGTRLPEVEAVIEDPDAAHVLKQTVYNASRTDSPDIHKLLAEALSTRFALPTGSEKAIIMNRALDVMTMLGPKQLNVLGALATIYAVRPIPDPHILEMVEVVGEGSYSLNTPENIAKRRIKTAAFDEMLAEATVYMETKLTEILQFDDIGRITTQDALHLASSGCIVFDTATFRDLATNMSRAAEDSRFFNDFGDRDSGQLQVRNRGEQFDRFFEKWNNVLQHCALTPVGVVIGLLVVDLRLTTEHILKWESTDIPINNHLKRVWDGEEIDPDLTEKVAQVVWEDRRFREKLHSEIRDSRR